jgi:glutamine synthetase
MFGYSVLRPSQHYDYNKALFDQLTSFGVPLEGLHTETGPGVYEAAIHYDSVLSAADKAVLFKAGAKEIASQFGIMASFMAKWNQQLPGCSGHIHQSLWDEGQQRNLFYDESAPNKMSHLQQHFVAGLLYCLPHVMPMYAPTVNSYKRLVEGAWAPTTISWGIENRTAAVRIINHCEKGARAELRVPGSDSNPYLAMAAALASGLYGIRNQIPLRLKMTEGNAYAAEHNLPLHRTLIDATHAMQQSTIANEILGSAFVEHFTTTRLHEWQQYSKAVTDWELKRYFEII